MNSNLHNPANLVSVIVSAYNAEVHIAETLESLLSQTYDLIEIIVINDGSTDNTLQVLKSFKDSGIIVLNQNNQGQDAALNNGFKVSRGRYIKFMDSDDLLNVDMIEIQVNTLKDSDDYVAYGMWARFYQNEPNKADFSPLEYWKDMQPVDFLTARPKGIMLQCGIMLVPRKLIYKSGLWDERLILFNDTEFFNRVILSSKGVLFSDGAKLFYRSGQPNSISVQQSRRFYESTYMATCLIANQLLAVEDSVRVRNLVSNMFFYRLVNMYPRYPDLCYKHEEKIKYYGCFSYEPEGGIPYQLLTRLIGWKLAKRLKEGLYVFGFNHLAFKRSLYN